MADGGCCLSDLPDDLLRHILFLLSRRWRWRWLWRTSGAVNLDSRSLKHRRSSHKTSKSNRKRSRSTHSSSSNSSDSEFFLGAEKALAAAEDPIRRLTFFVAEGSEINLEDRSASASDDHSLIEALVSNPAARCVEELRIEVEAVLDTPCTLSFGSLPSEALQVLRIVNCSTLTAAPPPPLSAATFPRQADLHLHGCNVSVEDLSSQ